MSLGQAPSAVTLVLAAELITLGRMVARGGPVAHFRQFRRGEQLQLPHAIILPRAFLDRRPQSILIMP
jgi:hypothetical protein